MSSLSVGGLNEKEASERELLNLFLFCGNSIIQRFKRVESFRVKQETKLLMYNKAVL